MFVNMWSKTNLLLWIGKSKQSIKSSNLKYVIERRNLIYTSSSNIVYAQPTPQSHPHLLIPGETTPGLNTDVYKRRRNRFLSMVGNSAHKLEENSISHLVLIPSASVVYMSENIPYPFRQLTDFLYLCGFKDPNSVIVMSVISGEQKSIIFVPKQTSTSERWEGAKMSLKDTTEFFGVDQTFHINDLEKYLQSFAKSSRKFTFWYDFSSSSFSSIQQTVRSFIEACAGYITIESPRALLHKCRLIKCSKEAELMRKTCKIGAESLREVIKMSKPSVFESHLHAKMDYECRVRGADYLAFPPVVGGGARANTIHYIDNNQVVNNNEMVLMDAGCEYGGYCSDLARTWPVNGKYTEPQRELYDLILSIQQHLIELCVQKPPLDYLFKVMCELLGKGLQDLGIIPQSVDHESVAQAAYRFCPHHVSHYLGMDVHDTNAISRGIKLLPGMVVTVEPGVYILKNETSVPEKYRGICIRIEDDVLITDTGVEVLTSACPKKADEIEKLMKS